MRTGAVRVGPHSIIVARILNGGPFVVPSAMSKRLGPGAHQAAVNPMGRCGEMSELQNLASFSMSDGCEWLTGQSIMMDGASHPATGGNFFGLHEWSDEQWAAARGLTEKQNSKDRARRE